jgi:DNA-binding MarR family transcriptional regulator
MPSVRPVDTVLQRQSEAFHEALSEFVRAYLVGERGQICCHDISLTQCYALEALVRRGPSTLNALAAELRLDKSTASRVVAALQRKGYVARAKHPGDARAVLLDATSTGRPADGHHPPAHGLRVPADSAVCLISRRCGDEGGGRPDRCQ